MKTVKLTHKPEHYNYVCECVIPESWEIRYKGKLVVNGDTRESTIEGIQEFFPGEKIKIRLEVSQNDSLESLARMDSYLSDEKWEGK